MTFEEIKKAAVDAITSALDEKAKNEVIKFLKDLVDTDLKTVVDTFVDEVKKQAVGEKGWCSFRDKYFLPGLVQIAMYALDKVLGKMLDASPAEVATVEAAAPAVEEATTVADESKVTEATTTAAEYEAQTVATAAEGEIAQ